jgi:hypothetical protein
MSNINVRKEFADVLKALTKKISSRPVMGRLAASAKTSIIKRTRLGRGVRLSGQTFKLPPLSPAYVEYRRKHRRRLSPSATVRRSNVHATGQLVEKSIRIRLRGMGFVLFINKARGVDLDGKRSKIDNVKLNRILGRKGRRWFDLSKAEQNGLSREIRKILLR